MAQAQQRMPPEHARTGITHHRSDLLAPGGLIAMHRTLDANGLRQPKPAALQPHGGIIQQTLALGAKRCAGAVMVPAITAHHGRNRLPFPGQTLAGKARARVFAAFTGPMPGDSMVSIPVILSVIFAEASAPP